MRVESIQVGRPREIFWNGREVLTSIFKSPVRSGVEVGFDGMAGDEQADPEAHGGLYKAVYAYTAEQYPYWEGVLGRALEPGSFGENLTTLGLRDNEVCSGDLFRIGTAELMATTPRMPCFKLGIRLGHDDAAALFLAANRPGIYFAVKKPGAIAPGDGIELLSRSRDSVTIADLSKLYAGQVKDVELAKRASRLASVPPTWRDRFGAQSMKPV